MNDRTNDGEVNVPGSWQRLTDAEAADIVKAANAPGREMFPGDFYNLLEFEIAFGTAVLRAYEARLVVSKRTTEKQMPTYDGETLQQRYARELSSDMGEWRPIATAPKNGEFFVKGGAFRPPGNNPHWHYPQGEVRVQRVANYFYVTDERYNPPHCGCFVAPDVRGATHWRPLNSLSTSDERGL
ncbi:hypothetical protein [Paraburkholderia sp. C35]|uniref:hypothetical protein n=1 Tax=Paraburkholderia sp. C35 TaxID=2126993 RepID=UPI000D68DBB8|nr:hypothetical protein [Paraburkholderia sp. C35]